MTVESRRSIDNAIWLCSNCSIDIDKDEGRYSVESLHDWKSRAEALARAELGKRLPSQSDTIDTVATALTGMPKNYIVNAIDNVHTATSQALQNLDPRFLVRTAHHNDVTYYEIHAKEDAHISMTFGGASFEEVAEKFSRLEDHGERFEIDTENLSVKGSDLLQQLMQGSPQGKLSISPQPHPALQKLWLRHPTTAETVIFDDIHGTVSVGSESYIYDGYACGRLFRFHYRKSFSKIKARINIQLNLMNWEGKPITTLPHLNKLQRLFARLVEGWEVNTSLEVNGIEISSGHGLQVSQEEFVRQTNVLLTYIKAAAELAPFLHQEVKFASDFLLTDAQHNKIMNSVSIYKGEYNPEFADGELVATATVVNEREAFSNEGPVTYLVEEDGECIELFGTTVKLPKKRTLFTDMVTKLTRDSSAPEDEQGYVLELYATETTKCRIEFDTINSAEA
ncbi:hypothetical protein [Thiohalomonas denitrificans]|nr:hypothetical protein [Thiohalomonas denitrificans]